MVPVGEVRQIVEPERPNGGPTRSRRALGLCFDRPESAGSSGGNLGRTAQVLDALVAHSTGA